MRNVKIGFKLRAQQALAAATELAQMCTDLQKAVARYAA